MLVNENELDDPDYILMEGSDVDFSDLEWQEKIVHLHNTHLFFKPPTSLSHTHRQTDRQTYTQTHTQLLVYQLHAPIILKVRNRVQQTTQTRTPRTHANAVAAHMNFNT